MKLNEEQLDLIIDLLYARIDEEQKSVKYWSDLIAEQVSLVSSPYNRNWEDLNNFQVNRELAQDRLELAEETLGRILYGR